jgi:hypothetical protein
LPFEPNYEAPLKFLDDSRRSTRHGGVTVPQMVASGLPTSRQVPLCSVNESVTLQVGYRVPLVPRRHTFQSQDERMV